MSNGLGSLMVELGLNSAAFSTGASSAKRQAEQLQKNISASFSKIGDEASKAFSELGGQFGGLFGQLTGMMGEMTSTFSKFAGVGAVATGAVAGLGIAAIATAGMVGGLAEKGAELVEQYTVMSEKTGLSIQTLVGFGAAADASGVSVDAIVKGVKKFDQSMIGLGHNGSAAQIMLKNLGVTTRDQQEALLQVADRFHDMADGAAKTTLAVTLFGKSGQEMIPILNKGREGLEEWIAAAGPAADAIKKAQPATEEWKKATTELDLSWKSFTATMGEKALPVMAAAVTAMDLFAKSKQKMVALAQIASGNIAGGVITITTSQPTVNGSSAADAVTAAKKAAEDELADASQKHYEALKAAQEVQIKLSEDVEKGLLTEAQAHTLGASAMANKIALAKAEVTLQGDLENAQLNNTKDLWDKVAADQQVVGSLKEQGKISDDRIAAEEKYNAEVKQGLDLQIQRMNLLAQEAIDMRAGLTGELPSLNNPNAFKPIAPPSVSDIAPTGANGVGGILDFLGPDKLAQIGSAQEQVQEWFKEWGYTAHETTAQILADYDAIAAKLNDMMAKGLINPQQYTTAFAGLNEARSNALQGASDFQGESGMNQAFDAWSAKVSDLGKSFFGTFLQGINDLNVGLAEFLVTGKKMDFRNALNKAGEGIIDTGLKTGESKLMSMLGLGGKNQRGQSALTPMYVQDVTPAGAIPAGGAVGSLSMSGILPPWMSALSGLFAGIPGLASGGDVTPGKAYVVGEDHPEFFVPHASGQIVPSVKAKGDTHIHNTSINFSGVRDMDTFKANESQLLSKFTNAAQRAMSK